MYRTHNCGELRISHVGQEVKLSGWVQIGRDFGGLTFIDLRDRYGITQLVFNMDDDAALCEQARKLGREFVISASGKVRERSSKNPNRPTGDVEIMVSELQILNASKTPPFTIEDTSDGGDDLRMKYRYLDIRRAPVQQNLIFRSQVAIETRKHLSGEGFIEIETPNLIKSTPEGARDFVVPSRMNPGQFYALPQSPQTFKQILMVAGMDKYFQIVKCFRDEDLRADRQPEFTQIDCEMAFVTREDILNTFEGLTKHIFKSVLDLDMADFPRMSYDEAMTRYGSDKPDIRFGMEFTELNDVAQGKGFGVFDNSELVVGICAEGQAESFSNKDIKDLTEWMQRPQIGAKGLVWIKYNTDPNGEFGRFRSSVSKFYSEDQLEEFAKKMGAKPGDMMLVLSGEAEKTRKQLNELRLEMGRRMGLMKAGDFKPLWVVNFPLLEWDEDSQRFFAMHHPFTAPLPEDAEKMMSGDHETLKNLRANAYDLVLNGSEIGGGSIRIHDRALQEKNFQLLGFTPEQAENQFGFLLGAFEFGAPPHGGIAFGLDRLCAVMCGQTSIRDFIAFPKNNMGRDMMIDAPDGLDDAQLKELNLKVEVIAKG
ncbi:MAG: aspartate--tRNA ligase [Saprospiraceae bacterium]|nr:aspartate--tRNA ligase [Saprospiraceae bacterium]MCF8250069.1 aspartate--tRNA ligase [Saprospiraceae bacterium]MCF8279531.1 aspartate--tRNA ligase [Bacteroidales bacterium]MCF8311965.1 aspartate--tRNA ligase [Saprospiraceae bacterium]MCF8440345.1 aspartate--tRNA ligase [Saprospiraceae bacterium]